MSDFILHHYPMSPFSQKVRSMLGHAGLSWHSVIHQEMPPRPTLAALAGGYRKIPVAQAGADVFCDSRIIAEEIAARAGLPELVVENGSVDAQAWVARVDQDLFFAFVLAAGNRTLRRKAWESMSFPDLLRFAWDRLNLGRTSVTRIVSPWQARPTVLEHVANLEERLTQDFLFGETPQHADFSTYHGLWMIHFLAESRLLRAYPRTVAWLERMQALGEGTPLPLSEERALAIARQSEPRDIAPEYRADALIGKPVSIAPADYGLVPTTGLLVGATLTRWIVARDDARVGRVHVHFPRRAYTLTPV